MERPNLIEGCRKAVQIVSRTPDLEKLYREAVRRYGEGELRTGILNLAVEAFEDENLKEEVFSTDESMLSFFCGIWIQFLLTEIAGVEKEKLRALARQVFSEIQERKAFH